MWNVNSYRYDEYLVDIKPYNWTIIHGREYKIDRLRAVPLIAYVVLFVIGFVGNIWVSCVIGCIIGQSRSRAPRSVQIYILALCCCDLVVLIFSLALIVDLFYGEWLIESKFLCLLYLSSESLNKFCSPFLLVALSYFCYAKICRPGSNAPISSTGQNQFFEGDTRKSTIIALICVILSFVALTPVFIHGDLHFIVYENRSANRLLDIVTKCAFEPGEGDEHVLTVFTVYGFTLGYCAPTFLFTLFHAAILYRVHRQEAAATTARGRATAKFLRVTKTIMGLVIFYIICWTPYWTLIMYQAFSPLEGQGELSDIGVVAKYLIHMLPYVNCTGYPIIITKMNRDIKEDYNRVKAKREANSGVTRPFSRLALFFTSPKTRDMKNEKTEEATML